MNENQNDLIITLDNGKKYALLNSIEKNSEKYVCLTNIDDFGDMIFGKLEDNTVTVVKDGNLLFELIKEFNKMNDNN